MHATDMMHGSFDCCYPVTDARHERRRAPKIFTTSVDAALGMAVRRVGAEARECQDASLIQECGSCLVLRLLTQHTHAHKHMHTLSHTHATHTLNMRQLIGDCYHLP